MESIIYEENQQCLLLIPEIVESYRKQQFFLGSKKMKQFTDKVSRILPEILNEDLRTDTKELITVLEGFLAAQENGDYVLMADILEGDFLPQLQQIQVELQAFFGKNVVNRFEENLEMIRQTDSVLYGELEKDTWEEGSSEKYRVMTAINGEPVLVARTSEQEIVMNSSINPTREAQIFAASAVEESARSNYHYTLFGMGMGYHVTEILKADKRNTVIVLENKKEVLRYALTYMDWRTYLEERRLFIIYKPDILALLKTVEQRQKGDTFLVHYPSLQMIEHPKAKEVLEDFFVTTSSMREQKKLLDENFYRIQAEKLPEAELLTPLFQGKTLAIVGGGPSVDEEIENIKKYRDQIVVFAVGTIAEKLVKNGIEPDVIVITDPQETMYRQIAGFETKQIPLILLSTASADILRHYSGKAYVVYQEGYEPAEIAAREKGYMLFLTGGSVSTLALDIAIKFKAEKIILIGMDMAYTGNRSHAKGIGREIDSDLDLRRVISTEGKIIATSKNLDIYRKWIERRIASEPNILIYNTGKGARIVGTCEKSLGEIMQES